MRWTWALVVLVACGEATPRPSGAPVAVPQTATAGPSEAPAQTALLPAGAPHLVVVNPTELDIDIDGAYLVDETGERGTMRLWPEGHDCPKVEAASLRVAKSGGELRLPFPRRVYGLRGCEPGAPLLAGAYLLRLHSGYGEELYAAARFTVPLEAPLELRFETHPSETAPCDVTRAQRAARLALSRAADLDWLPRGFFDGCSAANALCAESSEAAALPPSQCTISLHDRLVRIARPAGDDAPRGLTGLVDREVVYLQRPEITRTSASRVEVGGHPVVISGTTSHHMHTHGGEAAGIGAVTLQVRNPLARALRYQIDGIELLADHSCALPQQVSRRPTLVGATPNELPPGDSTLEVRFARQEAYQTHCNRFATRVRLRLEGQLVAVSSEHEVTRMEPFGE